MFFIQQFRTVRMLEMFPYLCIVYKLTGHKISNLSVLLLYMCILAAYPYEVNDLDS